MNRTRSGRPLLTPRARTEYQRLADCVEKLVDELREQAPLSVALAFTGETLIDMAAECRERAADCADHEADDAERFRSWWKHDA